MSTSDNLNDLAVIGHTDAADPAGDALRERESTKRSAEAQSRAQNTLETLEAFAEDHALLADLDPDSRRRLQIAAGKISRPERDQRRALRRVLEGLERESVAVLDIGLRRPTLDDVFLSLTGHAPESDQPTADPSETAEVTR